MKLTPREELLIKLNNLRHRDVELFATEVWKDVIRRRSWLKLSKKSYVTYKVCVNKKYTAVCTKYRIPLGTVDLQLLERVINITTELALHD